MSRFFSFLLLLVFFSPVSAFAQESAYDRVISTDTLRCGYGIYPPFVVRDANTGEMSGYVVDLMEEFGDQAGLKIEWTEEVDWGQLAIALSSGKVDAICSTIWASPYRAKAIGFSRPVFFSTVVPVVRADDLRFDNAIEKLNDPDYTIVVNDSDISEEIAMSDYPLATRVSRPRFGGEHALYLDVINKKADVTFSEPNFLFAYMKENPGKVRIVPTPKPIRAFANVIGVDLGETKLLNLIDATLMTIQLDGTLDKIFGTYKEERKSTILLPSLPYMK